MPESDIIKWINEVLAPFLPFNEHPSENSVGSFLQVPDEGLTDSYAGLGFTGAFSE